MRIEHVQCMSAFPVIDAHNHIWGGWKTIDNVVRVMDEAGVVAYSDLTANRPLVMGDRGYAFTEGTIEGFFEAIGRHPGKFYGFTTATFCKVDGDVLFDDAQEFVGRTIEVLNDHVQQGAIGLKLLKSMGLQYVDGKGKRLFVDDERLEPIWVEVERLGIPVLMHQADPDGFFEPATPTNPHCGTLARYPDWSFSDPKYPRKWEILEHRDNLVRRHPGITFMLPHVANKVENLEYVEGLLGENKNVHIDFSARIDELGYNPTRAERFLVDNQDRIYFGTDMPVTPEMYACYFRFLQTSDEGIVPPDYDGTFGRYRWTMTGVNLPRGALQKIYNANILRIVPGLEKQLGEATMERIRRGND